MKYVYYVGCLLLVAVLCKDVLSEPTEKDHNEESLTVENVPTVLKRQTNFQNDFNEQIPQEYLDFVQQTDTTEIPISQQPKFRQQNTQQEVIISGMTPGVYSPTTTKTLSPFTADQVRFQGEYAQRTLTEQQHAILRSRQRLLSQTSPLQFQVQPSQNPQQQPITFLDPNEEERQQSFVLRQQKVLDTQTIEPFSYAQVQFGSTPDATTERSPIVVGRPKGQRSASRPRTNHVVEPVTQQTVDYPTTTVINPVQLSARLLQNVVNIQPNGQMHKSSEEVEPVVHIPRRITYYDQSVGITSGHVQTNTQSTISPKSTTTTMVPVEEQPVILIPRPKKPSQRINPQEARNPGRTQQQFEAVKTERSQKQQNLQQYQQTGQQHDQNQLRYQEQQQLIRQNQNQQQRYQLQSSEVEPDNFITSLLSRFQQQQQPYEQDTTVSPTPMTKVRNGQMSKNGNRGSNTSKYLADRNQLQLLQFPHELKSLSSAELKTLEEVAAAANDESSARQKQLYRNRPVNHDTAATTSSPIKFAPKTIRPSSGLAGNRPVPTPVELNEQQRQFLAAQGIRHLYRVDYDQSGNALPLTYVLALDSRPKRGESQQQPVIDS